MTGTQPNGTRGPNGLAKLSLGLYRAVVAAALVGIGAVLWSSVQTGIRLEEKMIALAERMDRSERRIGRRLSRLENHSAGDYRGAESER